MKVKKEFDNTSNSYVYKKLAIQVELTGCPICSPNRGCNRRRKKKIRNWKKQRKTKWKE